MISPNREQKQKSLTGILTSTVSSIAAYATEVALRPLTAVLNAVTLDHEYDLPRSLDVTTRVTQHSNPEASYSRGLDSSQLVARFPDREAVRFKTAGNVPGDEMMLANLAQIPGMLATFSMTSAGSVGDVLWQVPVNPRVCNIQSNGVSGVTPTVVNPTPLAKAATPFAGWRGSIRYLLYVTASSFHSARIRLSYIPHQSVYAVTGGTPDDVLTKIVDINGSGVIDFVVPYENVVPFTRQSTGIMAVLIENPPAPIAGTSTAPIFFALYVAGCGDFQVSEPCSNFIYPAYSIAGLDGSPFKDYPHWNPREDIKKVNAMELWSAIIPATTYFQDPIASIGDAIKGSEFWLSSPTPASGVVTLNASPTMGNGMFTPVAPTNAVPYEWYGNTYPGPSKNMSKLQLADTASYAPTNSGHRITMIDHFADCFRFSRGGMRIKVRPYTPQGTSDPTIVVVYPPCPNVLPYGLTHGPWVVVGSTGTFKVPATNPTAGFAYDTAPAGTLMEFELPFRSTSIYQGVGDPDPAFTNPDAFGLFNYFQLQFMGPSNPTSYSIWRSAADDFVFSFNKALKPSVLVYEVDLSAGANTSIYYAQMLQDNTTSLPNVEWTTWTTY